MSHRIEYSVPTKGAHGVGALRTRTHGSTIFISAIAIMSFACPGCVGESPPVKTEISSVMIRRATAKLDPRTFKSLGIAMNLPADAMNVEVRDGKSARETLGCKVLTFVLASAPTQSASLGDIPLLQGFVMVYDRDEYLEWLKYPVLVFGGGGAVMPPESHVIREYEVPGDYFGMKRRAHRLDKPLPNGGRLVAVFVSASYDESETARSEEDERIRGMLNSIVGR